MSHIHCQQVDSSTRMSSVNRSSVSLSSAQEWRGTFLTLKSSGRKTSNPVEEGTLGRYFPLPMQFSEISTEVQWHQMKDSTLQRFSVLHLRDLGIFQTCAGNISREPAISQSPSRTIRGKHQNSTVRAQKTKLPLELQSTKISKNIHVKPKQGG